MKKTEFIDFLGNYKKLITDRFNVIEKKQIANLSTVGNQTAKAIDKIFNLAKKGKMIRGCLYLLSCQMYGKKINNDLLNVACALELIHTSLLIHDDIMDQDRIRRRGPSMHKQYQSLAEKNKFNNPSHYGISQAISVGDLSFFIGINIISKTNLNQKFKIRTIDILSNEISNTAAAQMDDVHFGFLKQNPEIEDIVSLYKFKTGRYTFSLPLTLGAVTCHKDIYVKLLERLGEHLGVVYQLQDDIIGITKDSKIIGKPKGSDFRKNKKTLVYLIMEKYSDSNDKKRLHKLMRTGNVTTRDLEILQKIIKNKIIQKKINKFIEIHKKHVVKIIKQLQILEEYKTFLLQLFDFTVKRNA